MKNLGLMSLCAGAVALAFVAGTPAVAQSNAKPEGYAVAKRISLPNTGGWDYSAVDAPNHRLYVSAGNQVDVVDTVTDKLVGTVPGPGAHGAAFSDKDNHGFTSNGRNDTSTEFNLKTLKVIKTIKIPIPAPDGYVYDPVTDRVFFVDHDYKAAAIDAKTGAVVGTVTLPAKAAEFPAADGHGHIFDNLESSSQEVEIDARTLKIMHVYSLAPCEGPSGLAMDVAHGILFAGCHASTTGNKGPVMAIMNAATGKVVATEPIGTGVDATRFDAGTGLAFASNGGSADITVIKENSPTSFSVVGSIPTEAGARTMALDPDTHTLYTVTAKFNLPFGPMRRGSAPARRGARGRGRGPGFSMVPGSFQLLVIPKS